MSILTLTLTALVEAVLFTMHKQRENAQTRIATRKGANHEHKTQLQVCKSDTRLFGIR